MGAHSEVDLLHLPSDHTYHLQHPFLVVTQKASDIGLVGWEDKHWTQQAPKRRSTSKRKKSRANTRDAPSNSPCAWKQSFDPESGLFYYYNEDVGVTQWEAPETFTADATVEYYLKNGQLNSSAAISQPNLDASNEPDGKKNSEITTVRQSRGENSAEHDQVAAIPACQVFVPQAKGDLLPEVERYWIARYSLFSKWAHGVCLNEKSLFSVTPELIAKHHAQMLQGHRVVVDAFCGCGGNAIQLAQTCDRVIACDTDAEQVQMARRNAAVYGVEDRIQFITGDFFDVCKDVCADAVFLSPPWGGPEYVADGSYDPLACIPIFGKADGRADVPNVAVFLPRNTSVRGLATSIASLPRSAALCLERNVLNSVLKSLTLYLRCESAR